MAVLAISAGKADESAFDYILWDGHRFARSAEAHERDFRWYADLGFTHSFLGNAGEEPPRDADRPQVMLQMAQKFDLLVGLRYHFRRDVAEFADRLGMTRQQMIDDGMLLSRRTTGEHPPYNPMHPRVIGYYADGFAKTLDTYLCKDTDRRLRLFLLGTEMAWPFPKTPEQAYPAALTQIAEIAREDGVSLAGGADDMDALRYWWERPHEKGGRWRLHKAIEDAFLERIPEADFMVDPTWAIKIVHGFGATWTYIEDAPKNVANAVIRLQAMTRPAPCAHSTQLIRGATHDMLLEANLLALCMGADKLYHWGINTIEPGREENPAYGKKDVPKTPDGWPRFRADSAKDWMAAARALCEDRRRTATQHVWSALSADTHGLVRDALMALDAELPADDVGEPLVNDLNRLLTGPDLYDPGAFHDATLTPRARAILARWENPESGDAEELNRLLIEAALPGVLSPSPVPSIREMREDVCRKRANKEPAIRATGRLLRERGALFRDWQPMTPRLALVGGIYGHESLNLALIAGQIPFDLLRNEKDKRARLSTYRFAALAKPSVSADDWVDLMKIMDAGGTVFVPPGFAPPDGTLRNPQRLVTVEWPTTTLPKDPAARRQRLLEWACELRTAVHAAGLLPYFDSEIPDIVMRPYQLGACRFVFVVNDRHQGAKGLANEVDVLIRDSSPSLKVIDIDTGQTPALERRDDGWHITDVLQPAWYKIYAVTAQGRELPDIVPLPSGPAVLDLRADIADDGVRLSWRLPFDDWTRCNVARYRIYRQAPGEALGLLADIPGRVFTGPGGVVTSFLDTEATAPGDYSYRVATVTPLRREGETSAPARSLP